MVAACESATESSPSERWDIDPGSLSLRIGDTVSLRVDAPQARWTTSNSAVATVTSDGVVMGRGSGQAVVEASADGGVGYALVSVSRVGAPPRVDFEYGSVAARWEGAWTDGEQVVLVGRRGREGEHPGTMLNTYDGERWTFVEAVTDANLRAVWGLAAGEQVVVGDSVVLRLEGEQARVVCRVPDRLGAVWGWADGEAVLAGSALYWYRNGQCTRIDISAALPGPFTIRGAGGSGPADIYLVGELGSYAFNIHPNWTAPDPVALHFDGTSWRRLDLPDGIEMRLYDIEVLDDGTAYAFGVREPGEYLVLRYDGSGWSPVAGVESPGALVEAWSDGRAIIAVGNTVGVTDDTGVRYDGSGWSRLPSVRGTAGTLTAVAGRSQGHFVAADPWGTFHRFSTGVWDHQSFSYNRDAWGASRDRVVAVGPSGAMEWNGRAWRTMPGAPTNLRTVWGLGPDMIFVGGSEGAFKYDGEKWHQIAAGYVVTDIWGPAPDQIYLTTLGPGVLRWDGSGVETVLRTDGPLRGIWGSGPEDIFVVGGTAGAYSEDRPILAHFDGSGWQHLSPPLPTAVTAVWGIGPCNVYALAVTVEDINGGIVEYASLIHYNGERWAPVEGLPRLAPWGLWGAGPEAVFLRRVNGPLILFDGTAGSVVWETPLQRGRSIWGDEEGPAFAGGAGHGYARAPAGARD